MLGSGAPSGVRFPVMRLSPFRESTHSLSKPESKCSLITTNEASERYEKFEM